MYKNEKGLTLIELLITIAVIAVVAAISVPVVSNVIAASSTNSLSAMQEQVDQFVAEAAESGSVTLNGSTLEARIDQDGDGTDEYLVKTFPVDSKYTVSGTGDGPYTVALTPEVTVPVEFLYDAVPYATWYNGATYLPGVVDTAYYGASTWSEATPVLAIEPGVPQYGFYSVRDAQALMTNAVNIFGASASLTYDENGVATFYDGFGLTKKFYYAKTDPSSAFAVNPLN